MASLDWQKFGSLPGSRNQNFENLCRALIRLHFGRYGKFLALKNQPGVEFHLKLTEESPELGGPPRWYGWQCKAHGLTTKGDLRSASRNDIEDSIRKTEKFLPGLTHWVLWTPYTLSKKDQEWFESLATDFTLEQWTDDDIETYLNGPAIILRSTYFGDLIATLEELARRHRESVQPIRERWLDPVHQPVNAERTIRRILGEPGSWNQMIAVGERLKKSAEHISNNKHGTSTQLEKAITLFVAACSTFAQALLDFHGILADGDLDIVQQRLSERNTLISKEVRSAPRLLRCLNLPISLDATNALDDMRIARELLDEIEGFLGVGLVAVLADAGGGKTQMAAQLTAPQEDRPAGILLHGRDLHKGQNLNDLAHHFSINGHPLSSMERLLAALDAAGKRAKCRLPVVIDGLSEAENPKDWKAPLAVLSETIKEYPNVVVVCMLRTGEHRRDNEMWIPQSQTNARESFAVMALPDGVKRIESKGFGGDVYDAITKYLDYFKINLGNTEIPVEFLQHPLNLRIFCQVINPSRESEVQIDWFPVSLSPLFDKYVDNVCDRISQMPNLSYSYTVDEVKGSIYNLGLELWKTKKRRIDEAAYRSVVSDSSRPWDSSIVNLLAQEGIIFRNPGSEPGKFEIFPAYDPLGGHIVADSLLISNGSESILNWFKKPEVIASFRGDESHELSLDIFKALVALTPRRIPGKHLWKEVPEPFRYAALRFVTELEAEYLDEETVATLLTILKDNPRERARLFPKLQWTRGSVNHPLNSEFLDRALRGMSVAERDLSWTEWVRGVREEMYDDLLAIERMWNEDLASRSPSGRLRAKWIMWLLTSTDHELRDVATRALYWFGRGDPEALYEESLAALEINDPYVPERMLAASYGVAMALHVNISNKVFLNRILSNYARRLYDTLFCERAPLTATHLLSREYAARTIELASLHNQNLFSEKETTRSKPPFAHGDLCKWEESRASEEILYGSDSPFRMDFANYALGRLLPERRNYDFDHEGYQKLRSQILWRIEQLGWSSALFKNVDKAIGNLRHWPRVGSDARKTDRYGKKYSWIAFFEMSGLLHDKGIVENWRERTSSVDIDPSFPERVPEGHVIEVDFLGDPSMDMAEWIAKGPLPNVSPYLRLEKLKEVEGPWIALDGFVSQEDEVRGRSSFCFIRSFLVTDTSAGSLFSHLSPQNLGGRWLPEKPDVVYTFAGEIPWCDSFPQNGQTEVSFEIVKMKPTQEELVLDANKLKCGEIDLILRNVSCNADGVTQEQRQNTDVGFGPIEVFEMIKEYVKFDVLIPVRDFRWESYHTVASDAGHAVTLAKEIAADMKLIGRPQSFDLFAQDGIRATLNVSDTGRGGKNRQEMFFMRENLLKVYLARNNLALIWAIWGERGYSSGQIDRLFHGPSRPEQTYAVFGFVEQYK